MRKVNWLLVGIMSFVAILVLFGAGTLLGDRGFGSVWLVRKVRHSGPPPS